MNRPVTETLHHVEDDAAAAPGIRRRDLVTILVTSYAARVPVTAIPLGLILVVRASGSSYRFAGLATGLYTLALSVTSPLLGRLADRFGAPRVFAAGAPICAVALVAIGAGAGDGSPALLLVLAIVAGAALPPLGALTRGLLTPLLAPDERARIFAIDATAQEICFISGPFVLAVLVAVTTPGRALEAIGGLLVLGAVVFGVVGSRAAVRRIVQRVDAPSPLRSRGLRAVLLLSLVTGMVFGSMELSIPAALDAVGHRDRAGILLGLWSLGTLLGGLLIVRWPVRRPQRRLAVALVLCILAGSAVALASGRPVLLAALLLLDGVAQAPLMAVSYMLVPLVVSQRLSEAFGWLTSGVVGGIALGTTFAGSLVDVGGASAGFWLAVAALAVGLVVASTWLGRELRGNAAPDPAISP